MDNKPHFLHLKPYCRMGYDIEWSIPYYDAFPDEEIIIRREDPCEHSCGSSECKECISNFFRIAERGDLTPDTLRERLG